MVYKARIKICGLSRPEDIDYVNEAKPDFCGFVINFPKSIRNTTPDQVRALRSRLSHEIVPVGVFVNQPVDLVAELLRDGTISMAQLHGNEDDDYIRRLKLSGDYPVIKAFTVKTMHTAAKCVADYVLLDQGMGSGQTFPWELIGKMERPFFLAGGLGSDNLTEALDKVRPWAVDLSSKVETDGVKDRNKIQAAVQAVRRWQGGL